MKVTYSILGPRKQQLTIWSCDPSDIPPRTIKERQRLHAVLAQIFSWKSRSIVQYAVDQSEMRTFTYADLAKQAHHNFVPSRTSKPAQFQQRWEDYTGRFKYYDRTRARLVR